jgi:xanthine dehydrogenase YagT iron-sulfur-binding subunit
VTQAVAPSIGARALEDIMESFKMSRRKLVGTGIAGAVGCVIAADGCSTPSTTPGPVSANATLAPPGEHVVSLGMRVNGALREATIDPRLSLLDFVREQLDLTGTKKGCDHGQCGACTVLVDGRRVNACLMLAVMADGSEVTTIEGVAHGDTLHPLQQAFLECDALQCGYCTPGQIMSALGLLAEGHATTDDQVREEMSGNLCRCGAYPNIVSAIALARKQV